MRRLPACDILFTQVPAQQRREEPGTTLRGQGQVQEPRQRPLINLRPRCLVPSPSTAASEESRLKSCVGPWGSLRRGCQEANAGGVYVSTYTDLDNTCFLAIDLLASRNNQWRLTVELVYKLITLKSVRTTKSTFTSVSSRFDTL